MNSENQNTNKWLEYFWGMERVGSYLFILKLGKYVMWGKEKCQQFTVSLVVLSYTLPDLYILTTHVTLNKILPWLLSPHLGIKIPQEISVSVR